MSSHPTALVTAPNPVTSHFRHTLLFSVLTFLSRIAGTLRIMVFAYAVGGRTVLGDAYQLAYLIPSAVYEFVAGGLLSAVFLPLIVQEQERHGKSSQQAWAVANLLTGVLSVILASVAVIAFLFAPAIISLMSSDYASADSEMRHILATGIFRYFVPQILFLGLNALCMAILNSHQVFGVTAGAPILNNFVVIATLLGYRFGWYGPTGLAIGTTLGTLSMILLQIPYLLRLGMPLRPRADFRDPLLISVRNLGWPIVATAVGNFIGWGIRSNLLTTVVGAFVVYTLCFQLIMVPYGILGVAIATVLYPALARHASALDFKSYQRDLQLGFRWTTFALLPVALILSVLALPIVRALFEHEGGRFEFSDSLFTSQFLMWYALSIFPYAWVMFATRAFYAIQDTTSPAWINILGVVVNAVLSYTLLQRMGVVGIAIAAGVCYTFTSVLSMWILRKKMGCLGLKALTRYVAKITVAASLMAGLLFTIEPYTRSPVTPLVSGQVAATAFPSIPAAGATSHIHSASDWKLVWERLGENSAVLPPVNFDRNNLTLVFAPRTLTSCSLALQNPKMLDDNTLSATINLHIVQTTETQTAVATLPYMVVQGPANLQNAHFAFEVRHDEISNTPLSFVLEFIWLAIFGFLAAMVYFITCLLLNVGEAVEALKYIRARILRMRKRSA